MMNDKEFDSAMEDINHEFFWHELRKDPEVMVLCPPTPALSKMFHFYYDYIRVSDHLRRKLSPEGEQTLDLLRFLIEHHADGLIPAREVLYRLNQHADIRDIFYDRPKAVPASVAPKLIPKPSARSLNRLHELRERKADRIFDELMREEDVLKAVRKKKCKRKSKAQRRKPPPYDPDVDDGDEFVMSGPPPPVYTPN